MSQSAKKAYDPAAPCNAQFRAHRLMQSRQELGLGDETRAYITMTLKQQKTFVHTIIRAQPEIFGVRRVFIDSPEQVAEEVLDFVTSLPDLSEKQRGEANFDFSIVGAWGTDYFNGGNMGFNPQRVYDDMIAALNDAEERGAFAALSVEFDPEVLAAYEIQA